MAASNGARKATTMKKMTTTKEITATLSMRSRSNAICDGDRPGLTLAGTVDVRGSSIAWVMTSGASPCPNDMHSPNRWGRASVRILLRGDNESACDTYAGAREQSD